VPKGGVKVCQQRLVNEVLGPFLTDFDFNRVKEYPLPIVIIILKDQVVTNAFKKYLLNRNLLTTKDVDLMLTHLCQIDFQDTGPGHIFEDFASLECSIRTSLHAKSKKVNATRALRLEEDS